MELASVEPIRSLSQTPRRRNYGTWPASTNILFVASWKRCREFDFLLAMGIDPHRFVRKAGYNENPCRREETMATSDVNRRIVLAMMGASAAGAAMTPAQAQQVPW